MFDQGGAGERHGIDIDDVIHAMSTPPRKWVRGFDEPRIPGFPRPDLWVGRDRNGTPLEIMGNWLPNGDFEVFHAMELRPKTRQRIKELENK